MARNSRKIAILLLLFVLNQTIIRAFVIIEMNWRWPTSYLIPTLLLQAFILPMMTLLSTEIPVHNLFITSRWLVISSLMNWIGHDLNMYTLSYTNITFAGLHASDDLAFNRDFEAVHTASRRLMNNGNTRSNNGPNAPGSVAYPDILNGGNRYNTPRSESIWRSSTDIFMHLHLYKYSFLNFYTAK